MGINIHDLNDKFNTASLSFLSNERQEASNLQELSEKELKTSGGAGGYGPRTVVVSDDDLDVYIIDNSVPTNFVYDPEPVEIEPNRRIRLYNGNLVMRKNGDIDITFSDSDSSSSSS